MIFFHRYLAWRRVLDDERSLYDRRLNNGWSQGSLVGNRLSKKFYNLEAFDEMSTSRWKMENLVTGEKSCSEYLGQFWSNAAIEASADNIIGLV